MSAVSGSNTINFSYNEDGSRASKTVNGLRHNYTWDGTTLVRDYYGNTILDFSYDANGQPYAMHYNSTPYFYILNLQGDVIRMVDGNGNTVANYEYDPYGRVISATGSMAEINPLRYRGYYYDQETQLYHLWSRYYDPQTGRFISGDNFTSTGQGVLGTNMYAYCGNNPTNRRDEYGNAWETVWDIASLVASVGEVALNPADPWAWAGLIGDIVDVAIPCIGGLGEAVDAIKTTVKVVDKGDDIIDAAKEVRRAAKAVDEVKDSTGAYVVLYETGQHYVGKGGFKRAIQSATEHASETNKVSAIVWAPTKSQKSAFVTEYLLQSTFGISKTIDSSLNLIWSPGKKIFAALQ